MAGTVTIPEGKPKKKVGTHWLYIAVIVAVVLGIAR